jgi:DNA repair exonuclease SbcCD ATPase subunit/DNA repair exonuclease SbcCD nuclease subunit
MTIKIAHIADIHWRGLSRHEEYRKTFEIFFKKCRKLKPDYIYIGGDIVHSKTQNISPELISHLSWWFTEMAKIAKVVVILGNHDGLMLNTDRMDTVSPIIEALNNDNICFFKDSGVHQFADHPGFNWCVLSCFDTQNWKKARPKKGDVNVALYHGAIWGSHTDMDFMLDGDDSVDIFKGFDFAMLGDIHKRQAMDKEKRIWYSGSTIPQNFSETQQKGFLFWTIQDKDNFDVKFHPIKHVHPYVTLDWDNDLDTLVKSASNLKEGSRVRIRANERLPYALARKISKKIRTDCKASDVVFKYDTANKVMPASEEVNEIAKSGTLDSRTIKKLLRTYNGDEERREEFWTEIDNQVDTALNNSLKTFQHGNRWSIKKMEFDNTFGYGKDNVIDFTKLNGIVGLFGRNRAGKSSIPGTLTYGLYNKNDRGIVSNLHVVNARADYCQAAITFSVNDQLYRSERQSVKCTSRGSETCMTHLNLYEVDEDYSIVKDMSGEQRRETEKELTRLIGTSDDFLLTSFASQGGMNSFINLGGSERRKTICRFLGLDVFSELNKMFRDASLETKAKMKTFKGKDYEKERNEVLDTLKDLRAQRDECKDEVIVITANLESQLSELQTYKLQINADVGDIDVIESHINDLKGKISTLALTITDSDTKIQKAKKVISGAEVALDQSEYERLVLDVKATEALIDKKTAVELKIKESKTRLKNCNKKIKLLGSHEYDPECEFCCNNEFVKEAHEAQMRLPDIEAELSAMNDTLNNVTQGIDSGKYNLAKNYVDNFDKRKTKVTELKLKLSKLELAREKYTSELTSAENNLVELEANLVLAKKASDPELVIQITALEEKINNLRLEKSSKQASLSKLATKIGVHQEKLKNIDDGQKSYNKILIDWSVYEFLLVATSWRGIPAAILQSMVPAINEELASILQESVGFTIELEIDDSKTEMYINYGDSRRPIECGSGMEKMVSSLALRVALTNISSLSKSDMLIIDEGFGSLDVANVEAVTQLLQKLRTWYRLIILISHVDLVKESVDDIIEITSCDKNAKVVYG